VANYANLTQLQQVYTTSRKKMLTLKHIKIYEFYGGDGDGFVRCATEDEKEYMTSSDWSAIEHIIQDLHLIRYGLVSKSYKDDFCKKLKENCEGEETINEVLKLALHKKTQ
jgi:hypothetical protein